MQEPKFKTIFFHCLWEATQKDLEKGLQQAKEADKKLKEILKPKGEKGNERVK